MLDLPILRLSRLLYARAGSANPAGAAVEGVGTWQFLSSGGGGQWARWDRPLSRSARIGKADNPSTVGRDYCFAICR